MRRPENQLRPWPKYTRTNKAAPNVRATKRSYATASSLFPKLVFVLAVCRVFPSHYVCNSGSTLAALDIAWQLFFPSWQKECVALDLPRNLACKQSARPGQDFVSCKMSLYEDHGGASALQLLETMKTDVDVWADADMPSVCRYLRGCKSLQVPESFREVLELD